MRITNVKYCLKIPPGEKQNKTKKTAAHLNDCSIRKEKIVSSFKNAVSVRDKLMWESCQSSQVPGSQSKQVNPVADWWLWSAAVPTG